MLALSGICYRYRRAEEAALEAVTLEIERGDVFGLLGPNGAGKTTLISLIAGLLPLGTGDIRLDGEPLAAARRKRPAAVALVPQNYAFYPMLTVSENLRFFAGVQGLRGAALKARVARGLAFARLESMAGRLAGDLSGGLKRRLNLAIGLLAEPDILLLDEPTAGVDPQSRHFLLQSIRSLGAAGKTVIYTSHYMDEIEAICNRVAIMDHGRILLQGGLDEVLADGVPEVRMRLGAPLPPALVAEWRTCYHLRQTGHNSYRLRLAAADGLPVLLHRLAGTGHPLQALSYGRQNLEQVFMQLTHRSLRD